MVDPISTRIDAYQADQVQLERDFAAAREALYSKFRADIAALVHNGNWQVYPERDARDAQRIAEHQETIRALKAKRMPLNELSKRMGNIHAD